MRIKITLGLMLVVYLIDGRAPGFRELRNPDAEHAGARSIVATKRAWV
ncbi:MULTISPECIES: hypothetical protein [Methylobacterium]|uniref:Uncharacterized protein n=1 Tax=Methylobacterium persicinum TaxID=374426 RepID=A0ABU0HTS8_9HYPH|nr:MULTISPECIES: hypothetical protein [Methylobacterium]MCJ2012567.1 hypothetical protein [Methylobacterium sp. J-076]MDQ0445135.1 hypothetical protein [Methylobacterium persicinum]GJE38700.1 hypothetical protein KHHGKMAE_2775 [Methylobacterium persicinum]